MHADTINLYPSRAPHFSNLSLKNRIYVNFMKFMNFMKVIRRLYGLTACERVYAPVPVPILVLVPVLKVPKT